MNIKYPINKQVVKKHVSVSGRGMDLEEAINLSNEYYLSNDIAVIHKKPTPVQVVKVSYPERQKAKIVEAYYKTPSTTDYNGIYKGKYIDFEAKETISTTSFPLHNIHLHQVNHLKRIAKHGGIGFFIVYWNKYSECYLLPLNILFSYWDNMDTSRKSIPYSEFKNNCPRISEGAFPRLDYLKTVKDVFF